MYRLNDADFARATQSPQVERDRLIQDARARHDKNEAQRQAEREELQKARNEESKAQYRAEMKQKWIANGGNETSFTENWPSMWTDELKRRVGGDEAKESTRQYLRSRTNYSF